jgi:hypothetical protein
MAYANRIGTFLLRAAGRLYRRPKFGRFLKLENIKYKIVQAAKRKEDIFPELVVSYLSAAFLFPKIIFRNLRWDLLLLLFSLAASKSAPQGELPMLRPYKHKEEKEA